MGEAAEAQRGQRANLKPTDGENCKTGLLTRKMASYTFSWTLWTWEYFHIVHSSLLSGESKEDMEIRM